MLVQLVLQSIAITVESRDVLIEIAVLRELDFVYRMFLGQRQRGGKHI